MVDEDNISVIPALGTRPRGRPKGSPGKRGRYITIASICEAIEDRLGCSYQEALAELLGHSMDSFYADQDKETFPKMMMQLSGKLIEQARQMPEDTSSELEELSDEELQAKQKQAVIDYIALHGIPNV